MAPTGLYNGMFGLQLVGLFWEALETGLGGGVSLEVGHSGLVSLCLLLVGQMGQLLLLGHVCHAPCHFGYGFTHSMQVPSKCFLS